MSSLIVLCALGVATEAKGSGMLCTTESESDERIWRTGDGKVAGWVPVVEGSRTDPTGIIEQTYGRKYAGDLGQLAM